MKVVTHFKKMKMLMIIMMIILMIGKTILQELCKTCLVIGFKFYVLPNPAEQFLKFFQAASSNAPHKEKRFSSIKLLLAFFFN